MKIAIPQFLLHFFANKKYKKKIIRFEKRGSLVTKSLTIAGNTLRRSKALRSCWSTSSSVLFTEVLSFLAVRQTNDSWKTSLRLWNGQLLSRWYLQFQSSKDKRINFYPWWGSFFFAVWWLFGNKKGWNKSSDKSGDITNVIDTPPLWKFQI